MSDLTFVAGDTAPSIFGTLSNITTDELTDAQEIRFRMRLAMDRRWSVDGTAVLVDASTKSVRYDWATGDLDQPGEYISRWFVVFEDDAMEHSSPGNTIAIEPA